MGKFADKVATKIKGDEAAVVGSKVESKVRAILTTQIALLNNENVNLGLKKTDAEEALTDALYPVKVPNSSDDYLYELQNAKGKLEGIEAEIKGNDESIAFYQELLDDNF